MQVRELLEKQLEQAEIELDAEVARLLSSKDKVQLLRKDVASLRGAIEAVSRGNGHPYVAQPVTTAADFIFELANGQKVIVQTKTATPTKAGEVRKALQDNPGLKTRELYEAVLKRKPSNMEVSMNDMHRILPRLIERGYARRDAEGLLWPTTKKMAGDD